jgi:NADH dehydrogenase
VIVGAGFAGLRAARQLASAPVQVTLIDQNNYHLFQPLLYQVATAGVSATDIAYPVRAIFRRQANFTFRMATVTGVDFAARQVLTERASSIAAPISPAFSASLSSSNSSSINSWLLINLSMKPRS